LISLSILIGNSHQCVMLFANKQ